MEIDEAIAPTERTRIARSFNYTKCRDEAFGSRGLRTFLQYRDLGLREATDGLMRAEHIRAVGDVEAKTGWHCHELDFQVVFVVKGHVRFVTEEGQTITLRAGDCAHLPALYRHDEIAFSPDFEVIEITAPAEVRTIVGRDVALPQLRHAPERVSRFCANYDRPDAYKVGDGPRRFLSYRDAGVTTATGRRVNINVVRNSQAGDASTGWHYHTLACQFVFILGGWSRVEVEGQGEFVMHAGDAMTIPGGLKHDVTGFSADFSVLELNVPADFDTIACAAPARTG